jgi:MFS transporter, Spinster family, sphingosine-1-phosphate transporter
MVSFGVLFAMNLLDYTDRWILAAVVEHIQRDFQLPNADAGLFNTYFLVSYSLVSPLMGWAGDRMKRTRLLFLGVGVWSLATVGTGLAHSYHQVVLARSLLGIGEATYGVIAPTMLMDLFGRSSRARVMSLFYLAMPIGGALGMALGGLIAKHAGGLIPGVEGWRLAFFVVGAPGLAAAFAALFLPEPIRGASEGVDPERLRAHEKAGPSAADYRDLMVKSSYNYAVFGMAAYTFAIGGLGFWFPKFLTVTRGFEEVWAKTALGLTTAGAAITGMVAGGWVADRLARRNPRALFLVPGLAMLAAAPFLLVALLARDWRLIFLGVFVGEALMFINTGPCNAVIANVVAPNMRGVAYAAAVFVIHFMGDVWSPYLMGWIADTFGQRDTMGTAFGQAFAYLGAVPTIAVETGKAQNLLAGMLVVVPALPFSGLLLLSGARHLPREMALMLARLKAAPQTKPHGR